MGAYRAFATRITAACEEGPPSGARPAEHGAGRLEDAAGRRRAGRRESRHEADSREIKTLVQNQGFGKRSSTVRTAAADPHPHPAPQVDPSREPIRYKVDRTVTTVTAIWSE